MEFKAGDKVVVTTSNWHEECTVVKNGYGSRIISVRRANGQCLYIHTNWASILKPKNQQLLLDFMD